MKCFHIASSILSLTFTSLSLFKKVDTYDKADIEFYLNLRLWLVFAQPCHLLVLRTLLILFKLSALYFAC
jgi:hypothetical protein